ncbi:MAG: PEP/pyruvate-binding domain-containing protein [Dehalococcoidia bacterium]
MSASDPVYACDFDTAQHVTGLGGKGTNLIRLRSSGFPVPDGFCLPASAYGSFVEANQLGPALDALANVPEVRVPRVAREAAASLAGRLNDARLPAKIDATIRASYARLRARTAADLRVAVRSSSLSEDGAAASSAGLYESYLQVLGEDEVVAAVLRCYRSLWSFRAIQYRATKGIDGRREAMAVVIMEMVRATVSGVTFTVNPMTQSADELVIDASWGLGEAIVAGRVTPDHFIAAKPDLRLLAAAIATKELEIVPEPGGGNGTLSRPVPAARSGQPTLSARTLRLVCEVCREVEHAFGSPQDIEWALQDETLFILQTRPITTLLS